MSFQQFFQDPKSRRFQYISLFSVLLLVFSISAIGNMSSGDSSARRTSSTGVVATNGLAFNPSSMKASKGSKIQFELKENSGTTPVNAVQAFVNFDSTRLTFDGATEGNVFEINAATDTSEIGVIKIARATSNVALTGTNTVLTLNFTVKSSAPTGNTGITMDLANSLMARTDDSTNLLQLVSPASLTIGK